MLSPHSTAKNVNIAAAVVAHVQSLDKVLVALSGGIDSMTLLALCKDAGLTRVEAVTGISQSVAQTELKHASILCAELNVPHHSVHTNELSSEDYIRNTPDRCFHCKQELYGRLRGLANELDIENIIDGTSAEDLNAHRPGHRAAISNHIISPWAEAKAHKDDIRYIARHLGLSQWQKPSSPCLSSRIAYGLEVTAERLGQVEAAEGFLRTLGFERLRVRHHNTSARIEVPSEEFNAVCAQASSINAHLKSLGFTYITLDLAGLRSGSLLEVLPS